MLFMLGEQMLSFSSIGALLLAVAIPVAVGFIGTAVGGGGDSGNCDRACKTNCLIFVTHLYIWHKDIQVYFDDLNPSYAQQSWISHYSNIQNGGKWSEASDGVDRFVFSV